jgi:hypothetical protein
MMTCRRFRKMQFALIDGVVTERQASAIRGHLHECGHCAQVHAAVRRGLLVARNLPPIEPSPNFMGRLYSRLDLAAPPAHARASTRISARA